MRTTATPLCEADCAIRGRHAPGCEDGDACRGCQPRQAVDGLRLCVVHADRLADDLVQAPALYDDLALVLVRRGKDGERMSGSSSAAPIPDEDVMEARTDIRSALLRLAKLVAWERGVHPPRTSVGGKSYVDTRPAALGAFLAKHAQWLAAHKDAGTFATTLHRITGGRVRAIAYPSGSDRLYVGDCPLLVTDGEGNEAVCGTRLYQTPDHPLIRCAGCGEDQTVEQWQRWIVGDARGVVDAYAVSAHLAVRWMRPVEPYLIRKWAERGHIRPLTAPDPDDPTVTRTVTDYRGRTLYDIASVVSYAESIWGPPYTPRR